MYRILMAVCLMISVMYAQDPVVNSPAESRSYELYQQSRWQELLSLHDSLHKAGSDYYYLRIRSAYAEYYNGRIFEALHELDKAKKFWANPEDEKFETELLRLSGESLRADLIQYRRAKKAGIEKPVMGSIFRTCNFETGYLPAQDKHLGPGTDLLGNSRIYGEQTRMKRIEFFAAGLSHKLLPGVSLNHQFTGMIITRQQEFAWQDTAYRENTYGGEQLQYYISSDIILGRNFIFSPAFHYLNYAQNTIAPVYLPELNTYGFYQNQTRLNNYIISGEISKRIKNFKPVVGYSFSEFNYSNQMQGYAGLTWFPTNNLNAYIHGGITMFMQNKDQEIIPRISAGYMIFKRWFPEIGFSSGRMYNYAENNGQMLFNVPDVITFKGFAGIKYLNKKSWEMGAIYTLQQRERYHLYYKPVPPVSVAAESALKTYTLSGLVLQLKYTFKN